MTRIKDLDDMRKNFSPDVLALNPELLQKASGLPVHGQISNRLAVAETVNKYGATRVTIQGEMFDSKKEGRRWLELQQQLVHGQISNLERQVQFTLQIGFDYFGEHVRPVTYTADFQYFKEGITYIEDCKSIATMKTEAFRIRWRLLQYLFKGSPTVRCVVS